MDELRRDLSSIFNLLLEEKSTGEMAEALRSLRPVIQSGTIEEILNEYNELIKIDATVTSTDLINEMGGVLEAYVNNVKRTHNMCRYCINPKLRAGVSLCEEHFKESNQTKQCIVM